MKLAGEGEETAPAEQTSTNRLNRVWHQAGASRGARVAMLLVKVAPRHHGNRGFVVAFASQSAGPLASRHLGKDMRSAHPHSRQGRTMGNESCSLNDCMEPGGCQDLLGWRALAVSTKPSCLNINWNKFEIQCNLAGQLIGCPGGQLTPNTLHTSSFTSSSLDSPPPATDVLCAR